jgi:hypothetical protein
MKVAPKNAAEISKYWIFREKAWLGRQDSNLAMAESKSMKAD